MIIIKSLTTVVRFCKFECPASLLIEQGVKPPSLDAAVWRRDFVFV
jgi:hypothetical protein